MKSIIDVIRRWRERWELEHVVPEELDRMLEECGLTLTDLATCVDGGEHVDRLLPAMLELHGLHADEIRRELGHLFQDLQRVCGGCQEAHQCKHLFAEGASLDSLTAICPNAATMAGLEPELPEDKTK